MSHLRLVESGASKALAFTNRKGETYYLHAGTTKTGKARYFFAKTVRDGALLEMPDGFEVSESINGVVSVRKKRLGGPLVPDADLGVVVAVVKRHRGLADHEVRVVGNAIVIFEPYPTREQLGRLRSSLGGPLDKSFIEEGMKQAQFSSVMKFELEGDDYAVFRMTYRGEGGWSYPLDAGQLDELAKEYVSHIGAEQFFELM